MKILYMSHEHFLYIRVRQKIRTCIVDMIFIFHVQILKLYIMNILYHKSATENHDLHSGYHIHLVWI
jgi:hypothetical protein